jgi:hypothetical protein
MYSLRIVTSPIARNPWGFLLAAENSLEFSLVRNKWRLQSLRIPEPQHLTRGAMYDLIGHSLLKSSPSSV